MAWLVPRMPRFTRFYLNAPDGWIFACLACRLTVLDVLEPRNITNLSSNERLKVQCLAKLLLTLQALVSCLLRLLDIRECPLVTKFSLLLQALQSPEPQGSLQCSPFQHSGPMDAFRERPCPFLWWGVGRISMLHQDPDHL